MSESQLDLSKLALDRSVPLSDRIGRRHRWISRYVLPAAILIGFLILLGVAAGRQLFPTPSVSVVPVIVKRGAAQPAGTSLFQAAGWIEPRPTAVSVAALTPGVIDKLLVVEGQRVTKGEPIAQLIAIDAELAVEQAKAMLALREGELRGAEAEQTAAVARLENPVHLKAELADAKSLLAKAFTEKEKLPFLIKAAQANVEFTRRSLEGKQAARDAVAGVLIERAASDHASAAASQEELEQRAPHLQREIDALQEKVNALQERLHLLIEERREVGGAKAKVASATALRAQANLQLRQAELNLERTVVRAPLDGLVLHVVAAPGTRVMGLDQTAAHNSSTVVQMYDPAKLQVRADVRLEDVPMVTPGAKVQIETASSSEPIPGRVLLPTSTANIQKNTLEVKVELIDPPPTVRPEMLVTATFLAPELEAGKEQAQETERIFVPKQLVRSGEAGTVAWIVDAAGRAIPRDVEVGTAGTSGLVEIMNGLKATDKLITSQVEDLRPRQFVKIGSEDSLLGIEE